MSIINIQNLTRDYGSKKGVFDVSIQVEKGEVLDFLVQMVLVKLQLFVI